MTRKLLRMHCFTLKHAALILLAVMLSACASHDQMRIADMASSPLSDLNLIRTKIPEVLLEAQKQPYAIPPEATCADMAIKIQALDAVLGPDVDTLSSGVDPSLPEQGVNLAKNAVIDALRSTSEGIIPFRGWVRRLSGAERHSRNVATAIVAGTMRRAFIKGLMASKPCV